uniref:Coiled-coil domain containing 12 n=1 Tax=Molossus molossus TaxID=27622 RepID=A0A7J8DAA0_MOLMO|nr:coiled-coil domain containing 12 [Molossus molossus]
MADAGFGRVQEGGGASCLLPRAVSSSTECDSRCLRAAGKAPKATPDQPSSSVLFPPPCCRDLKRDVAKKLEKLEKRTQRAIAELIRERLRGQEDSLASAVDASTEQEACDSD